TGPPLVSRTKPTVVYNPTDNQWVAFIVDDSGPGPSVSYYTSLDLTAWTFRGTLGTNPSGPFLTRSPVAAAYDGYNGFIIVLATNWDPPWLGSVCTYGCTDTPVLWVINPGLGYTIVKQQILATYGAVGPPGLICDSVKNS